MKYFLALWIALVAAAACQAGERVALVVGNSTYQNAEYLPNAVNDARDMAAMFKSLGFIVFEGYDLTRRDFLDLSARMARKLSPEDVAVVYYAGHGAQVGTRNFLMPVDVRGDSLDGIRESSVSLSAVLREIELRADTNVVLLDACRNNPFEADIASRSGQSTPQGLARVDASVGSFIAFATEPGNVALDGRGRNSPFAAALLRHLPSAEDDLHEVMRKVRKEVVTATNSFQVPWENSSLIDRIYLARQAVPAAPAVPNPQPAPVVAPVTPTPVLPTGEPTHVVQGLDPNGDGFLALRNGPSSAATMTAKMPEGTPLVILGQQGQWMNVRTQNNLVGWAHSGWIAARTATPAPSRSQPVSCDALWYQRNEIFHRRGYCFQSARGQAAFSNAQCIPGMSAGQTPLSAAERARVNAISAQEAAMGCR